MCVALYLILNNFARMKLNSVYIILVLFALLASCRKDPQIAEATESPMKVYEYKLVSSFVAEGDYFYGLSLENNILYFTAIEKDGIEIKRYPISKYMPDTNLDTFFINNQTSIQKSYLKDGVLFSYTYYDALTKFADVSGKMKINFNGEVLWNFIEDQGTSSKFVDFVEKDNETIMKVHQINNEAFDGSYLAIDEFDTKGNLKQKRTVDLVKYDIHSIIGVYDSKIHALVKYNEEIGTRFALLDQEFNILSSEELFQGNFNSFKVFPFDNDIIVYLSYEFGVTNQIIPVLVRMKYDGTILWKSDLSSQGMVPHVYTSSISETMTMVAGQRKPNNLFENTFYPERSLLFYSMYDSSGKEIASDSIGYMDIGIALGSMINADGNQHMLLARKIYNQYPGFILYTQKPD